MSAMAQSAGPYALRRLLPIDGPFWITLIILWLTGDVLSFVQHIHATRSFLLIDTGVAFLIVGRVFAVPCRKDASLPLVFQSLAAFILTIPALYPLAYVAVRSPFPAVDARLAHLEAQFGFDPVSLNASLLIHPWLHGLLSTCYRSFGVQYLAVLFAMPRTRWPERGLELMRLSIVSICMTYVTAFLIPTIGTIPSIEPWAATWHALHDNRSPVDLGSDLSAIISLPSYHAAMAVMLVYVTRGFGLLSWLVVLLNVLLLLATPAFGCHHLTDVAAGMLLAVFAILTLRRSGQA